MWKGYLRIPKWLSISTEGVIKVFDSLKLSPNSKVLDVGCGYGKLSKIMTDKGFDVTAIDNSKEIINEIKNKNFKTILMDAKNLKFPKNSFDLVFTDGLLEHLKNINDIQKIIQEEIRVSKKYIINFIPKVMLINDIFERFQIVPKEYRNRNWLKIHESIAKRYAVKKINLLRLNTYLIEK